MAGVVQQQVAVSYAQAGNHEKAMAAFERVMRRLSPSMEEQIDRS
jgi:pentatricopeptide repeat protein